MSSYSQLSDESCSLVWQCSWGSKPTVPGSSSGALPPPPPGGPYQGVIASGMNLGYGAADILAYQRQLGLTQAAAGRALLPLPHQSLGMGLGQSAALGGPASRGIYDGFQQGGGLVSGALSQQHAFY